MGLMRTLAFMHGMKFAHKDLKPENIMMADNVSTSIKVIDFGLAELFPPDQRHSEQAGGTLPFMAPEVFQGRLGFKSDVWSAGVILYNLLTGDFPFIGTWPPPKGKDQAWWQEKTMDLIRRAEPQDHPRLNLFSPACTELLQSMLRKDVGSRPGPAQCLEHSWFQNFSEVPPTLSVGVVQCVEAYAGLDELRKAIFLLIAHQCALTALPELRALFTHFDYRNRGTLSTHDLHQVLMESGMGDLRAERVLHALDRDSDGQITWTEFTAAATCVSVCRNRRFIDTAFTIFDLDRDGSITKDDLLRVIAGRHPACQEAWQKNMPALVENACAKGTGKTRFSKAQWLSSLLPTGHKLDRITLEQFRAFVGENMNFRAGDALYAVS